MGEIARQPEFIVAVLCATLSFATMSLLMTATPLAATGVHHSFSSVAFIIQWHVVAMFAPGFFTGALIARFGTQRIIGAGLALLLASILIALAGTSVTHFWLALACTGVGWNFGFTGATALLTSVHRPSEKAKVQAANDFAVFGTVALMSLFSGVVYHFLGWTWVNLAALPLVALAGISLVWLAWKRPVRAAAG
jgi:MFS family permease